MFDQLLKLSGEEDKLLNERFRVRLLKKDEVPVVCDIPEIDEHALIIDFPKAEGYELTVIEAQKMQQLLLTDKSDNSLDSEKENLPIGCELGGDLLKVAFLSIEKLDNLAATNKTRMGFDGFETAFLDRFADFDVHLVPRVEAHGLLNDISIAQQKPTGNTVIIFSEGKGRQNKILFGMRQTSDYHISFEGSYLGDYFSSINLLARLTTVYCNNFVLREDKCRCRYDTLRNNVLLIEKSGNFIPATFVIEAEWELEKGSADEFRKLPSKCNYLSPPPDKATATLKFKPGWMDMRIVLTERVKELRYLAELAAHLKANKSPWSKSEVKEQPEIIEHIKQLIAGAKDKLDAQGIYPFDFTDRLWDVLKLCRSFDSLRHSLELIYVQLKTGEFRVLIEANKTSSLAIMLRTRDPKKIIFPRLEEPMSCLQFLVEIGVDRFNSELLYRFFHSDFLQNISDLEPFSIHPSASLGTKIEQLLPLYLALQSMFMMEEYAHLRHEKANLAKRLLTHYTSLKGIEAFEKEFVWTIKMEDIRREKLGLTMTDWVLERNYNIKASNDTLGKGTFSEAVHISRNFGFKYLRPHDMDSKLTATTGANSILVKKEVQSPVVNPVKDEESTIQSQFECIYLTIHRTALC